jgi:NAD+ synthase
MGFSYDLLDEYIRTGQGPPEAVKAIERMEQASEHKRRMPPIFPYQPSNGN